MYKNLMKILSDKKITMKAYAEFLDVSEKTVQNKVYGRTEFTLGEAIKTCTIICPEYKLDFVFEKADIEEEVAIA
ncbi:MAG: DNA-binding protein [Lachnospiraceae bacterium]|nr:DNA-binding protein [Lachnospiraceae bacterium]